jgi:4-hydroxythreonine-4-phosphate dehydrogenase
MDKISDIKNKIRVGITHGDLNGIGYEIIIKTLMDTRILELFTPVVYGSSRVASYHRKTIGIDNFSFNLIKDTKFANPKRPNIINCYNTEIKVNLGESTDIAGELAYLALEAAVKDLKNNKIDVLVTAPINKKNIQSNDFTFPGHTEYLARKFDCKDSLMLMVSNKIRIGVVTGHIPVKDVASNITQELLLKKTEILNDSLIKDFGIRKPKIAILGLNPHAGDQGLIGDEEQKTIIPGIKNAYDKNILAFGPYAADGFFGSSNFAKFDGILAMYHDQGLIPFKTLSFDKGVNFTAGLPIVRTSPGHGTAYDIAGQNQASPNSFRDAIYMACDIYRKRLEYEKLNTNPL